MAGSLNKVVLIGNVGRDPEIKVTNDGKSIASFSLATSEHWTDKATGNKKEKTEWHRIVVFNDGLVKIIERFVKKGSKIYLEGNLQTRKWVDASGQEKYSTEVILQNYSANLILLDARNSDSTMHGDSSIENKHSFDHSELDDEIPF